MTFVTDHGKFRLLSAVALLLVAVATALTAPGSAQAAVDYDCSDFSNQAQAQAHLLPGDPYRLDGDHDGVACQSLPCPCNKPGSGGTVSLPDADVDGIPDINDACPAVVGSSLARGCPDRDVDGVQDASDRCPDQYGPAPSGCPDTDADTIIDPDDVCPSDSGTSEMAGCPDLDDPRTARVVSVVDGDTLKVRLTTKRVVTVRLIGIDTPEAKKPGVAVECGGRQATRAMQKLALDAHGVGRVVTVTTDPTQGKLDRYGRLLAYVRASITGKDLAAAQIAAGWSATYIFNKPFAKVRVYQAKEQQAKARGAGVWSACGGDFHSEQ